MKTFNNKNIDSVLFELSPGITHSELVIDFCADDRSHDSQVFLQLSSACRFSEAAILVGSKHHFLVLR